MLPHDSGGGVGGGDGRDILVGHVVAEVGRPRGGDVFEASLELVDPWQPVSRRPIA